MSVGLPGAVLGSFLANRMAFNNARALCGRIASMAQAGGDIVAIKRTRSALTKGHLKTAEGKLGIPN